MLYSGFAAVCKDFAGGIPYVPHQSGDSAPKSRRAGSSLRASVHNLLSQKGGGKGAGVLCVGAGLGAGILPSCAQTLLCPLYLKMPLLFGEKQLLRSYLEKQCAFLTDFHEPREPGT